MYMITYVDNDELKALTRGQMAKLDMMKQTQVAAKAGVDQKSVSRFINEGFHIPKNSKAIMNALGIELKPVLKEES